MLKFVFSGSDDIIFNFKVPRQFEPMKLDSVNN